MIGFSFGGVLGALESLFGWLLEASWQASVLAVLVLLLQGALHGRLNPRWHHALWLLVVARLLLPVLPESALSLFQFAPPPPPVVAATMTEPLFAPVPMPLPVPPTAPAEPLHSPLHPLSAFTLLALVWLAGALGLLLLTWQVNRRFARHVAAAPAITDPRLLALAENARRELGIHHRLRIIESAQVRSPAIMGLFFPTLILPVDVRARFTDDELRFIFLHEFAHLKRGDLFLQWLIALLQIVHWFNPVLWHAFRRMRIDREPATDALVLSRAGEAQKESYGHVLVKLLEHYHTRHALPTLVGILEDKDQFKRRFTLIARFTRGAYGWSIFGVFAITVLSVLCLTKQNSRASEPVRPTGHAIGHLVNEHGHSISGAQVETICYIRGDTTLFGAQSTTSTNASGIFLLNPEKGYEAVGVRVSAPGFARKIFHLPYNEQTRNLVMGHGVTVTGSLSKDGKPLPNIQVGIAQTNRGSATFLEEIVASTDRQGRFVLRDVAPHDAYEVHAKRDSLGMLGVTGELRIKTGDPDTVVSAGNLAVAPGQKVSGQLELSDGKAPVMPNDNPVQLHVYRHHGWMGSDGAFDYQYINLGKDLKFTFLARTGETLTLSAWIPGYHTPTPSGTVIIHVTPHLEPIPITYQPDVSDPAPKPAFTPAAVRADDTDQRSFDEILKNDRGSFADSSVHTSTLQADAAMLLAIQKGDVAALKRILEHAVDPHTFDPDRFGSTPAYWAVYFNQPECLKLLLDHFAEDDGPTHRSDKSALDLAQKAHPDLVPILQEGVQRNRAVLTARLKKQLHSISIDLPAFSNAPLHDVVQFLIEAAAHAGYLERRVGVATMDLPPSTTLTSPARVNVTLWNALGTITSANNLRFDAKNDGAGMIMLYPPQAESIVHPVPTKTDNAAPTPASSTDATQKPVRVQMLAVDMDESEYQARREQIDDAVRNGFYLTLEKVPSARDVLKLASPATLGRPALFLSSPSLPCIQAQCTPTRQNGKIALTGTITVNSVTKTTVNGNDQYGVVPISGAAYPIALQIDPQKLEAAPPQGILEPAAALTSLSPAHKGAIYARYSGQQGPLVDDFLAPFQNAFDIAVAAQSAGGDPMGSFQVTGLAYVVQVLGHVGTKATIELLRPLADNPEAGRWALDAIAEIRKRCSA